MHKCTEIDALWRTQVAPTKFISFSHNEDDNGSNDDDVDDDDDDHGILTTVTSQTVIALHHAN